RESSLLDEIHRGSPGDHLDLPEVAGDGADRTHYLEIIERPEVLLTGCIGRGSGAFACPRQSLDSFESNVAMPVAVLLSGSGWAVLRVRLSKNKLGNECERRFARFDGEHPAIFEVEIFEAGERVVVRHRIHQSHSIGVWLPRLRLVTGFPYGS